MNILLYDLPNSTQSLSHDASYALSGPRNKYKLTSYGIKAQCGGLGWWCVCMLHRAGLFVRYHGHWMAA